MSNKDNLGEETLRAMQVVADNIVVARRSRELTQAQVAEACGLGLGTYQAVERGALTPTMRSYAKVLEYFDLGQTLLFLGAPIFDDQGRVLRASK